MTNPVFSLRRPGAVAVPLAVAALALAVGAAAQTSASPAGAPVRVIPAAGEFQATSRTNVREQPSTRAQRIDLIDGGAKVHVTGKVPDAPWYAIVTQGGKAGFVSADQLRAVSPAPGVAAVQAQAPAPAPVQPPAAAAPPAGAPPVPAEVMDRLDRMQARLDALEQRLPSVAELDAAIERQKRAAAQSESLAASADLANGLIDAMGKLQDQFSAQMREQRDQFGRLGERIDSVEESVRPAVDWAREWTGRAAPMAEEAQGWFSAAYGWMSGWMPWGSRPVKMP
ncbi:hypothetical protein M2352_005040 [Azospirillum fermentarium]|uniref:SH3 domain-containing protein n=1 Tax=Azospirillum fermentarium TaxID=1233114 RepID=UPI0022270DEB|nr:SH3 domain-containing protein [Azospirillum fermentarium]MCW2249380.1 hypothetical protein [Azospirillum fermentarium]